MVLEKLKNEREILHKEIKDKTVGYILGALGLVAGLAWNEAIKSLIDQFFPNTGNGIFIKFAYAILVTIVIVIISVYLLRFTQDKKS